jgi:glutamate dehydrogenase
MRARAPVIGCRGFCDGKKAWIPESREEMEKIVVKAHAASLEDAHHLSASEVVPWFFKEMPNSYFNIISEESRMRHLRALTALRDAGAAPELMIHNKGSEEVTFIQPKDPDATADKTTASSLAKMLDELPPEAAQLARVNLFSARDGTLNLNVFDYAQQEQFTGTSARELGSRENLRQYIEELKDGKYAGSGETHAEYADYMEMDRMDPYLLGCGKDYVDRSNVRRFMLQRELFEQVSGRDGVAVAMEEWIATANDDYMITVASANVLPLSHLQKMMAYLELHNMTIGRAHLDVVNDGESDVSMIRILVERSKSKKAVPVDWDRVSQDISRLKWLDDEELKTAQCMMEERESRKGGHPMGTVPLLKAEVVQALSHMVYGVLNKVNPYAFSKTRMSEMLRQPVNINIAAEIAALFVVKFDPDARGGAPIDPAQYAARAEEILQKIQTKVEFDDAQLLLTTLLDAVSSSLRTNAFCEERFALAIKIDPTLCGVNEVVGTDMPFGTLFVHGRRFNGFHVRFRDIARGGLRVVVPPSKDQHMIESARQYDEVYSLAFAQQLKNKDIPEGGSKAVVLVDPAFQGTREEEVSGDFRGYLMRKSVKAFTDSMLDMVTIDPAIRGRIVDYYNKDELIYLGPDENVIPEDINWIIDRAGKRGYPIPAAFMSSKPDAGINHKVYGVTSEGVAVFLDTALRAQGKHPDDTGAYTVMLVLVECSCGACVYRSEDAHKIFLLWDSELWWC